MNDCLERRWTTPALDSIRMRCCVDLGGWQYTETAYLVAYIHPFS